ncbi:DNA polymerase lambda [Hypsibius exemplaris]|uniref:DNA polymerase n=1 Tax=Hypsibius exemplaris TaxID=2072580 RepID=A0A1W0XEU7_HYPEX|nr:DNA polymerase lambda [Hypsibius exemplaris]
MMPPALAKARTSRAIPTVDLNLLNKDNHKFTPPFKGRKSPKKSPADAQQAKKARSCTEVKKDLFKGKSVYFVPLELPKARRDLFTQRVQENGATVWKELVIGRSGEEGEGRKYPDYVIVDDHVGLDCLCRALDKDYPVSKNLLSLFKSSEVMRAKWLSLCLSKKELQDKTADKLNDFLKSWTLAAAQADANAIQNGEGSSLWQTFPISQGNSPDRSESYHSDDDHKSNASNPSDGDGEDVTDNTRNDTLTEDHDTSGDGGHAANNLQKNNFFLSPAGSNKKGGPNQHIIDQLEEMMTNYRNMGDEFRTYAYVRAISAIRKYPNPILDSEQIKDIKNVGPRIAKHIMEIIETGHYEQNTEAAKSEDTAAMKLFVNIHGVGTKTARKWVQMGLRTLEDVKSKIALTPEQTVGLKYYEEFQQKMSRKEVEEIAGTVQRAVNSIKAGFVFEICGSYRRGREHCGDVDLLMTHPDGRVIHESILEPLLTQLHKSRFLTDDLFLVDGPHKKYFGVCRLPHEGAKHRRLDIIIPPYSEWATCVLGWSGSMYFVRSMRDYAHKKGMSLSNHSLRKSVVRVKGETVHAGERLETPTEESIFQALGLPYLRPEERDH